MSMIVIPTEASENQKLWLVPEQICAIIENFEGIKMKPTGFVTVYLKSGQTFSVPKKELEEAMEQYFASRNNRIS